MPVLGKNDLLVLKNVLRTQQEPPHSYFSLREMGPASRWGLVAGAVLADTIHIIGFFFVITLPLTLHIFVGLLTGAVASTYVGGWLGGIVGGAAGGLSFFFGAATLPVGIAMATALVFMINLVVNIFMQLSIFTVYKIHGLSLLEAKLVGRLGVTMLISYLPFTNLIPAWTIFVILTNWDAQKQYTRYSTYMREQAQQQAAAMDSHRTTRSTDEVLRSVRNNKQVQDVLPAEQARALEYA